ncbi:MAG: hypothetical protein ACO28Q_08275 [Ilumatobacteraceae bacterium]
MKKVRVSIVRRTVAVATIAASSWGLMACGGDESSQSPDEIRDEVIALLFTAAANGASSDGTDAASVVLKALEDNPDLLNNLDSGQLEDLRDALVSPEVSDGQEAAQEVPEEEGSDMPSPSPGSQAPESAPDESQAPSAGGSSGPSVSIVSIPTLSVPNINWGAVTDILNSGSNDSSKISIPTPSLSPISVPSTMKILMTDLKIIEQSPLAVTFNITEASADIKTVAFAWTAPGLTGSGEARFVEKVSDTKATWRVGSMPVKTTALRITVTDAAGVVASFVYRF